METFVFSVHTNTEAKQYAELGRAEPGLEPGRWIFQPDHLTWRPPWCSVATGHFISTCIPVAYLLQWMDLMAICASVHINIPVVVTITYL